MPGWIDFVAVVGIAVALLAVLGVAAERWGTDSRDMDQAAPAPLIGGH